MTDQELPASWINTTIGEACVVIQGQSPPGTTYNTEGVGLPFLQGKAEFGATYPNAVKWCTAPSKIAEPGDVLISIRAPVGPTNLCAVRSCIGRGLATIRTQADMPAEYVLYALRATQEELRSKSTGTTFEAIRGDNLRSHPVRLPPLPEQHCIVAAIEQHLTRLDAAVTALKRVQANLQRYRASVLKTACEGKLVPTEASLARAEGRDYEHADRLVERILVERRARWAAQPQRRGRYKEPAPPDTSALPELPEGWVWATLAQISELKGGATKGRRFRPDESLTEVPYLRVANVQRGYLDLSEMKTIEVTQDIVNQLKLVPGDILFTEGGDRDKLGRGWVWSGEIEECIHQNHVFRSRVLLNEVQPEFISWWGNSFGQQFFERSGKQTTNLASINLAVLSSFPVPVPPAAEQRRIVAEVERHLSIIQQAEATVETSLKRAERLRQSILKQAFSGQLVPQDPNDEPAAVLLARIQAQRAAAETAAKARRKPRRRRARPAAAKQLSLAGGTP